MGNQDDKNIFWRGEPSEEETPTRRRDTVASPVYFFVGFIVGFVLVLFGLFALDNKRVNDKIRRAGIPYYRPDRGGRAAIEVVQDYWYAFTNHDYDKAMTYVEDANAIADLKYLKETYLQSLYESGVSEYEFRRRLKKMVSFTYYCNYEGKESKEIHRVKTVLTMIRYYESSGGIKSTKTYTIICRVAKKRNGYKIIEIRYVD